MLLSGSEALTAGQDLGYTIEPIFGLNKEELQNSNQLVELLLYKLTSTFIRPESITTVLQDHMKNRKSEVDNINGWVVDERRKRGKAAPVNEAIVKISDQIKRGELDPGPANLELLQGLLAKS